MLYRLTVHELFQPFLRFWGLCIRLLWVFKFFFGFLWVRRSAWNHALHSFHTALGESETPFFGAPRRRRRENWRERCAILRSADRGLRLVEWWVRRALGFASVAMLSRPLLRRNRRSRRTPPPATAAGLRWRTDAPRRGREPLSLRLLAEVPRDAGPSLEPWFHAPRLRGRGGRPEPEALQEYKSRRPLADPRRRRRRRHRASGGR